LWCSLLLFPLKRTRHSFRPRTTTPISKLTSPTPMADLRKQVLPQSHRRHLRLGDTMFGSWDILVAGLGELYTFTALVPTAANFKFMMRC
jgi:hypothetical protein